MVGRTKGTRKNEELERKGQMERWNHHGWLRQCNTFETETFGKTMDAKEKLERHSF